MAFLIFLRSMFPATFQQVGNFGRPHSKKHISAARTGVTVTGRAYYSSGLDGFLDARTDDILGELAAKSGSGLTEEQKKAWADEIGILQKEAGRIDGTRADGAHIFLEFEIPRMGKRADVVFVLAGMVFVIEFKGGGEHKRADIDQCVDYALDLKNFHEGSHDVPIVPILSAPGIPERTDVRIGEDGVFAPMLLRSDGIGAAISAIAKGHGRAPLDAARWEASRYRPTPTIIDAATALYSDHRVEEIRAMEANLASFASTTNAVEQIIERSKRCGKKSICFVTGVPGAGKTLAGLVLANKRQRHSDGEHAVFLSGNGPLVEVLREALVRDAYARDKPGPDGRRITKKRLRSRFSVTIQALHRFLGEGVNGGGGGGAPHEKILVFDEAQRAWDSRGTDRSLIKKNLRPRGMSQPELLIEIMGRHEDWAVIVCLVGGGQEINHSEVGLPGWLEAVRDRAPGWDVYMPERIKDMGEYRQDGTVAGLLGDVRPRYIDELHLAVSRRSFRSEKMSEFVKMLLDIESDEARKLLNDLYRDRYQIALTRNFDSAKKWLRGRARGSERFGVVAAGKSYRLKPHGIYVELATNAVHWFLNPREDPRSSYSMEYAATEFEVQGLELDWACVAWDGDLRREGAEWDHREFSGERWKNIHKDHKKRYLKNAYRVLLTRARQGMVIFVPRGDSEDGTRHSTFYDGTYCYLRDLGITEV